MAQRRGQHVDAEREGRDLKVRADGCGSLLIEDAGIIVRAVDLELEDILDVLKRIVDRAVDGRAAAEGEGVLQCALGIGMLKIAALEEAAALCGTMDLTGQATHLVHALAERLEAAVETFEVQAVDGVAQLDELFDLLDEQDHHGFALRVRGDDGKAVLGAEDRGLNALGAHGVDRGDDLAVILDLALTDDGLTDHAHRAHVALTDGAAAHGAGVDAVIQKLFVHFKNVRGDTRAAAEGGVEADAHHRAHFFDAGKRRNAEGVAVDEVAVVLLEKVLAEFAVLVPAHAVVQAVDGLAVSRHVKKHLAGFVDEGDDLRVDLHGAAVINDGVKILQRQVFSV